MVLGAVLGTGLHQELPNNFSESRSPLWAQDLEHQHLHIAKI